MTTLDADDELRAAFRDESADALDAMLRLRDGWAELSDAAAEARLLEAFRIFHNLKGAARLVGLAAIEPLAHAAEDALRAHHATKRRPDDAVLDKLARAILTMLRFAEGAADAQALEVFTAELSADAATLGEGITTTLDAALVAEPASAARPREHDPEGDVLAARAAETVRVRVTHLDRLIAMTAELLTHHAQLGAREARLEGISEALREAIRPLHGEAREAIVDVLRQIDGLLASDRVERQRLGLLSGELGDTVRAARMLPLSSAVPGFRRIAEDAAEELGKRIRFEAHVGDIALDRRILDGLRDPMMHLLRNAVDHGVESPARRHDLGKPEAGAIVLRARSLGASVEITLEDDGRGIDRRAVIGSALRAGALTEDRVAALTDEEVVDLVFAPGLSTAKEVTRLSGRGIGLDVVRSRVRELGGTIVVSDADGKGTTFRLALPVTVVQTSGLLVRVGEGAFAIPMTQVVRTQRIPAARVRSADGGTVAAQADDDPLRLLWLASLLGTERQADGDSLMVVVVEHGAGTVGLVVEAVIGEAEFVVRPLPWNLERVAGVVGAAVLADGELAIVLHVTALLSLGASHAASDKHTLRTESARTGRCVLVVDDSVTSRILVRNILDAAGYETLVANDGEEAWEILQRRTVDLVVTDVQMPRLDGHGLTRRIRKEPRTADVPIIMVTSLSRPEDVALGSAAGADEYIVKGRFDHRTLLEAVARLR